MSKKTINIMMGKLSKRLVIGLLVISLGSILGCTSDDGDEDVVEVLTVASERGILLFMGDGSYWPTYIIKLETGDWFMSAAVFPEYEHGYEYVVRAHRYKDGGPLGSHHPWSYYYVVESVLSKTKKDSEFPAEFLSDGQWDKE